MKHDKQLNSQPPWYRIQKRYLAILGCIILQYTHSATDLSDIFPVTFLSFWELADSKGYNNTGSNYDKDDQLF